MQPNRYDPAGRAGTAYVVEDSPVMIVPENFDAPSLAVIITLWGIAASAFVKAIPKAVPAGTSRALGVNAKSFASSVTTSGLAVGLGFGVAVGRGEGDGVGFGFAVAVGRAVAAGVERGGDAVTRAVGDGEADGVAGTTGLSMGSTDGDAGLGVTAIGAVADSLGAAVRAPDGPVTETCGVADPGEDPPQAATSNPIRISRGGWGSGTAAL
jgi:hypothetical protein